MEERKDKKDDMKEEERLGEELRHQIGSTFQLRRLGEEEEEELRHQIGSTFQLQLSDRERNWKMYQTCVDPALQVLEEVLDDLPQYPLNLKNHIQTIYLDLRFFKMFFQGFVYQEESSELDLRLRYRLSTMNHKFKQTTEEFKIEFKCASQEEKIAYWTPMSYHLKKKIQQYKSLAKHFCFLVLHGAFKCKSCQFEELVSEYGKNTIFFIDLILGNLHDLHDSKIDLIAPLKKQFSFIQGKLKLFRMFAYVAKHSPSITMARLLSHIQAWVNHMSSLTCLYWIWINEMDESLVYDMGIMLSNLMERYMPYTPKVVALYIGVFKATRNHNIEIEVIPRLLVSYVDFLLEHLAMPVKNDIEILREQLIFLLSFLVDSPKEYFEKKESILPEIDTIVSEVTFVICASETKLSDFLYKMYRMRGKIRDMFVLTQLSPQSNSPKTNAIGFLDSVLGNLKKMLEGKVDFIPCVKNQVEIVHEELELIKPFLQNILDLQNEPIKLTDLQTEIINMVYHTAYVMKLCPVTSKSIWYGIISLSKVIEDIKLIKSKVQKIKDDQLYTNKKLTVEMESSNALLQQATTSPTKEETFIGFEQDVKELQEHLVWGRKDLTIISISGMAGSGKTTLAKRIYNDRKIQYHFNKISWCQVSKECNTWELLSNIIHDVSGANVNSEILDLAGLLRKQLKERRFLIVLDDIWDVDVWCQVQLSFPDDKNGSRILFTSRNHELGSQAKPNSISHPIRSFSYEECWKLMKCKLSNFAGYSPEFLEIGKRIIGYCNGLPLAVALISSHLKRIAQVLDLWEQVAKNLKSHLSSEGCMHIIELSYKYLSDHLKPCFLYFGSFPRGKNIRANKLKLLWIAEGFVRANETQCLEDLAKEYLDNLVSQNLVIVTERSSTYGIKSCNVHDLLYDLCLEKAVQDNFLHLADKNIIFDIQRYDFQHRFCIIENGPFTLSKSTCTKRELPTNQVHSLSCHFYLEGYLEGYKPFSYFLSIFKVLTILNLEGLSLPVFPTVILHNIHLKYLAIGGSLHDIPSSIVDFWNLETLVVKCGSAIGSAAAIASKGDYRVWLPNTLWEMKCLKYVDIDRSCLQLKDFYLNESLMVAAQNIEVLSCIFLKYNLMTEIFLRSLLRLRKLSCYYDEDYVIHPKWFSMLKSLDKLEVLSICPKTFMRFSNQQLTALKFPDNLKKLNIMGLQLPWSAMSIIGKLHQLEVLKLSFWACEGPIWNLGDREFSKLRYLKLTVMDVIQIDDSECDDPFPNLEKLFLIKCERLEKIPFSFGNIPNLNRIDVSHSPKVSGSIREIVKEQEDMGNHDLQVLGLENEDDDDKEEL